MMVFIYDTKTNGEIERLCKEAGLDVLTPEGLRKKPKRTVGDNQFFLEQVDLLIMEITQPERDATFLLAQAILLNKPMLCLYTKNKAPRALLDVIKHKVAPRPVKTLSYTDATLLDGVQRFLDTLLQVDLDRNDIPSIKFTLRLSPRIDDYLNWYSQQHSITKADYLRALLTRLAKQNKDYRRHEKSKQRDDA